MKTLAKIITTCVVGLSLASAAHALQWTDVDDINQELAINGDPDYSNTFNILNDGYNPATMKVTSAVASFAFSDGRSSDDDLEYVDILLDNNLFVNDYEADGTNASWDWVSNGLSGTFLANLQDGVISYRVVVNNTPGTNDTYLMQAKLVATGSYKTTNRVPDGGMTIGLLGLALLGVAALRKRLA